jgi:hypothetical protein
MPVACIFLVELQGIEPGEKLRLSCGYIPFCSDTVRVVTWGYSSSIDAVNGRLTRGGVENKFA